MRPELYLIDMSAPDPVAWTIVRNYSQWSLRINLDQGNLFGVAVQLHRFGNIRSMTLLSRSEQAELWGEIVPAYEHVIDELVYPDHYDYEWPGKLSKDYGEHGHLCITPRYRGPRVWRDRIFYDRKGQIQNLGPLELLPEETIELREAIAAGL